MYVIAMNRLRGAYVDLDPAVERYFLAAVADDMLGSQRTYSFLRKRNQPLRTTSGAGIPLNDE